MSQMAAEVQPLPPETKTSSHSFGWLEAVEADDGAR